MLASAVYLVQLERFRATPWLMVTRASEAGRRLRRLRREDWSELRSDADRRRTHSGTQAKAMEPEKEGVGMKVKVEKKMREKIKIKIKM